MNLLVTGGAGFIGSNFIHYLAKLKLTELNVTILDNLTYAGSLSNLKGIDPDFYKFIKGDICDRNLVEKILPNTDFVVHFAAESHVDNSIKDPSKFIHTNVVGTQILLDASILYDIKKFIYVSTDEVYGSISSGSFVETDILNPSSPYSASKAAGELLVNSYGKTFGLNYNITRCSNNYGPRQNHEKLIPCFINLISMAKPLPLYGDGKNIRNWIYVDDHCEAIFEIIKNGKNSEIFNIGGSNEFTNLEIAEKLIKFFGADKSLISFVADRKGHDLRYSISSSKISTDLNFVAKTDFLVGLENTIQWYLENKSSNL